MIDTIAACADFVVTAAEIAAKTAPLPGLQSK